jgi:hypothetical protein
VERKLLSIDELVAQYGLPKWTVRSYCSQRKIPFIKIGRRVYFDPLSIEKWVQEHVQPVEEVTIP